MPEGLWIILVMIAVIIIYALAKVYRLMRISEEQWREVDKSKLKKWEDEED